MEYKASSWKVIRMHIMKNKTIANLLMLKRQYYSLQMNWVNWKSLLEKDSILSRIFEEANIALENVGRECAVDDIWFRS